MINLRRNQRPNDEIDDEHTPNRIGELLQPRLVPPNERRDHDEKPNYSEHAQGTGQHSLEVMKERETLAGQVGILVLHGIALPKTQLSPARPR